MYRGSIIFEVKNIAYHILDIIKKNVNEGMLKWKITEKQKIIHKQSRKTLPVKSEETNKILFDL